MGDNEVRLVYFDIRGFAEPIRWILKIAGQPFEDERIPLDAWAMKRKRSSNERLRNLYEKRRSSDNSGITERFKQFVGQLPIFYEGEFVLTQTLACLRYLAIKYDLVGDTQLDEARADEVSDLVYDIRQCAVDYMGKAFKSPTPDVVRHTVFRDFKNASDSPEKQKMLDEFKTNYLPRYLRKFSEIQEKTDGIYIASTRLTYADLVFTNFIDIVEDLLDPDCLQDYPKLKELRDTVLAIPEIVDYRNALQKDAIEFDYNQEAG